MKYRDVRGLATILEAIRAGEPVPDKTLRAAELAVQRELEIKAKAAERSREFFATAIYRQL